MGARAKKLQATAILFSALVLPTFGQRGAGSGPPVFNVVDYGAHKDASALATEAFRRAIAAAQKAGGGTVYVPAGRYITGPIEMVSNLTLEFDAGAIVRFRAMKLPLVPGRQQGIEVPTPTPLIGGHDLENVSVIGRGVLTTSNVDWMRLHTRALRSVSDAGSANGEAWEHLLKAIEAQQKVSPEEYQAAGEELRPSFIRFKDSKNIRVDGLRIIGSSMWTVHLLYSENAVVENLVIETYPGVHGDGVVVDSSRYVKLLNNYIDTGDDGIVLKAGKDRDGLRVNRPTENVTIENCTVHHAQAALAIGSETSGGVHNVVASNITAKDTVNGIHIKSRRSRGGTVENIRYNNWTMENVGQAITISDAGYQMEGEAGDFGEGAVTNRTPTFRNIAVSHITINGAQGLITVAGLAEMPTANVHISDVIGTGRRGLTADYTDGLELHNVQLNVEYGPAFSVQHSSHLELDDVGTRQPLAGTPLIWIDGSTDSIVRNSRVTAPASALVSTPPGQAHSVVLMNDVGGDLKHVTVASEAAADWPKAPAVTKETCLVRFDMDPKHPTALSDESKLCLDLVASALKKSPEAHVALIGNTGVRDFEETQAGTTDADAAARARNSRDYLVQVKGVDPTRIEVYTGQPKLNGPEDIDQIEAQMVTGIVKEGNVETVMVPHGVGLPYAGLQAIP